MAIFIIEKSRVISNKCQVDRQSTSHGYATISVAQSSFCLIELRIIGVSEEPASVLATVFITN